MEPRAWQRWFRLSGAGQLRDVLRESWDPIGVGIESPTEYDAYLGRVAKRLRDGDSAAEIAPMLTGFTERMSLKPDRKRDRRAAEAIVAWYAQAKPEEWVATHRPASPPAP